jgi:hypothetical protein
MHEAVSLGARIEMINEAAQKVVDNCNLALTGAEPEPRHVAGIVAGLTTILCALAVAASEIAHNVGRMADQSEAAFNDAVKSEAQSLAVIKDEEKTKRSFIGQPK